MLGIESVRIVLIASQVISSSVVFFSHASHLQDFSRWPPKRMRMAESSLSTLLIQVLPLQITACLRVGRLKNILNGFVQRGVELSGGLLSRQSFGEGRREARHNTVIAT